VTVLPQRRLAVVHDQASRQRHRRRAELLRDWGLLYWYSAEVRLKRALFNQSYLGMPRQLRGRTADLCGW